MNSFYFRTRVMLLIGALAIISPALASDWVETWTSSDLPDPESIVFDEARNVFFVSYRDSSEKPGGALVGQLTTHGAVIEKEWAAGLSATKDMLVVGNSLYVLGAADLVEIDIDSASIVNRFSVPGDAALTNLVNDTNGNIFVTEALGNLVYRLDTDGNFEPWSSGQSNADSNGRPTAEDNTSRAERGNSQSRKLNFDDATGTIVASDPDERLEKLIEAGRSIRDVAYLGEREMFVVLFAEHGEITAFVRSDATFPIGVRRNGSYYTRIEWADATLDTPLYWVANINDDDTARNGGSWGAPTMGPANVVLSFFGESQEIGRIRLFHNVGATISPLDELASKINIYVSDDPNLQRTGDKTAAINDFEWRKIVSADTPQKVGWLEFVLDSPVRAHYVRLELVANFGTPPERAYTETNELVIYPY